MILVFCGGHLAQFHKMKATEKKAMMSLGARIGTRMIKKRKRKKKKTGNVALNF